jgi:hypothetical protein
VLVGDGIQVPVQHLEGPMSVHLVSVSLPAKYVLLQRYGKNEQKVAVCLCSMRCIASYSFHELLVFIFKHACPSNKKTPQKKESNSDNDVFVCMGNMQAE